MTKKGSYPLIQPILKWSGIGDQEVSVRINNGKYCVYNVAYLVEEAKDLPKKEREEVLKEIQKGELPAKKIREIIREKKDNQKRLELAKKHREMKKQKEIMEKLRLQIRESENKIIEYKNAIKNIDANLIVIAQEVSEKYTHFESDKPDYVITHLGIYYDSLDMGEYDKKLKKLREDYDELERPLREKLNKFETEYGKKRDVIEEEKRKKNIEVKWVEKHQDLMLKEYNKQEFYKKSIIEVEKKLKVFQEKYDDEYK